MRIIGKAQENDETDEQERNGFLHPKRDGALDNDESIEDALSVLEYLNYIDGFCTYEIDIEADAKHGRFVIQRAAINTIRKCQAMKKVFHGD